MRVPAHGLDTIAHTSFSRHAEVNRYSGSIILGWEYREGVLYYSVLRTYSPREWLVLRPLVSWLTSDLRSHLYPFGGHFSRSQFVATTDVNSPLWLDNGDGFIHAAASLTADDWALPRGMLGRSGMLSTEEYPGRRFQKHAAHSAELAITHSEMESFLDEVRHPTRLAAWLHGVAMPHA